jgi:SAM-dependent methyltransferase
MATVGEIWRATLGWERRRQFMSWITGDDAPTWRPHEYKRPFARTLIRYLTAADSPPWNRVVMNAETRKIVAGLNPERLEALEISGESWKDFGFKSYRSVHYPEYDVCAGPLREQFDLIIAEQVFEHLPWPYRAGRHVFQMLRPGGFFLITTPFLFPVHGAPMDCSRWTETGIKYLLAECGFPLETCATGSWGNRACVNRYMKGRAPYRKWRHSLRNQPANPVVIWAVVRKP